MISPHTDKQAVTFLTKKTHEKCSLVYPQMTHFYFMAFWLKICDYPKIDLSTSIYGIYVGLYFCTLWDFCGNYKL